MEPNSPKKIQFAVPLFQSHLDPQAAEHIRKRRPTPATLVIYNDPSASADDKQSSSQGETQSAQLSPAQRKTSVYTPPTMRELQLVVEQHFQRQEHLEAGFCDSPETPSPITEQHHGNTAQWANHNCSEQIGNETNVSSDGQAESSEAGGREHSDTPRSGHEENLHPPKLCQSPLATLSEEPTDVPPRRKDTPYQHPPPFTTGVKLADSSSALREDEENCSETQVE